MMMTAWYQQQTLICYHCQINYQSMFYTHDIVGHACNLVRVPSVLGRFGLQYLTNINFYESP